MSAAGNEKKYFFFLFKSCPIFEKPFCHMLRTIAVLSTVSAVMHTLNRGFCKQHKKLMI